MSNTYTITHFSDWISKYPTWNELKAYITSKAGGSLSVFESKSTNEAIIRYDKTKSDMDREDVRWCRSVIWNTQTNRPLSVATKKSEDGFRNAEAGNFMDMTKAQLEASGLQLETFMEGVTMNLYSAGDVTRIASRTRLGATGSFYSNRSFAELYNDACNIKGVPNLRDANFMCIMLQHPEHRIVTHISRPNWTILHTGHIAENGDVTITEAQLEKITLPDDEKTLREWFGQAIVDRGYNWQGMCIKDGKGRRWRCTSVVYRMIRTIRGETPRKDERFFNLRTKGLVKSYLYYYPEEKQDFWNYESWLRSATDEIFNEYCAVYKERSKEFGAVAKKYQVHLSTLHGLYTNKLRGEGKTINRGFVREYMNGLPVPRLLFLMNFDKRPQEHTHRNQNRRNAVVVAAHPEVPLEEVNI